MLSSLVRHPVGIRALALVAAMALSLGCSDVLGSKYPAPQRRYTIHEDEHIKCATKAANDSSVTHPNSIALILLIDKSRSLKDDNLLVTFKQMAIRAVQELKSSDYFGIIGFDLAPFEILQIDRVKDVISKVETRVKFLVPSGQTSISSTLSFAAKRMKAVKADAKHLIILTDTFVRDSAASLHPNVEQLQEAQVKATVLAFGPTREGFLLEDIADCTGGNYYQTFQKEKLVQLMLNEIRAYR